MSGKKTELFVRFSTVAGERDIRRGYSEHAGELLSGSDVSFEWPRANTSVGKIDEIEISLRAES
jgi:hypothetical protein